MAHPTDSIRLGLPDLTGILPHHWSQLTTTTTIGWQHRLSLHSRVQDMRPQIQQHDYKVIIEMGPKASWCQLHMWAPLWRTWCSLWTIHDEHKSPAIEHCLGSDQGAHSPWPHPSRSHCCRQREHWSRPGRRWNPQKECSPVPPLMTLKRVDTLNWCLPASTNISQELSPHPEAEVGYPLVHRGKLQRSGTEAGGNKNRCRCPLPLTVGSCGRESSLEKRLWGPCCASRWSRIYVVRTSQPRAPAPAPSISERWHSTSLELASAAENRTKTLCTDPFGSSCRWWTQGNAIKLRVQIWNTELRMPRLRVASEVKLLLREQFLRALQISSI